MPRPPSLASLLGLIALAALGRPAAAFTPGEAKMPMTVTLVRSDAASCGVDCPEWLALTGKIGFETTGRLAAALARLGKRRVPVLLDSPGGESLAGLAMGRMIRAHGLDTAVATTTLVPCGAADAPCRARERAGESAGHIGPAPGVTFAPVCASACVLVLAGGVARAAAPGAFVGVHQAKRVLTFHPVMNTFRTLSRIVNGRKVEVSRTLIATRAMPVRVVTEAAPQSLYDQFERTLIGLGVDESIVPLMRATPPSGIHWMTAAEMASTRIITTTEDAGTLLAREAAPAAAPLVMALAAAKLGDGERGQGIADWRVSSEGGEPVLRGTVDVPWPHLHGTLLFRRDARPGAPGGIVASVDLGPPAALEADKTWTAGAPSVCDAAACTQFFTAGEDDDGRGRRAFRAPLAYKDSLLSALRARDWISVPLSEAGGAKGWVSLSVKDDARPAVAAWERLCCGFGGDAPPPVAAPAADGGTVVSWTVQPDGRSLKGTADLRGAGLRLSLEAGPVPHGTGLVLDAAVDPDRFGPLMAVEAAPVRDAGGRLAAAASARRQRPGVFEVDLAATAPVPAGARLDLVLVDARDRRLPVSIPLPKVLTDVMGAQPRPHA